LPISDTLQVWDYLLADINYNFLESQSEWGENEENLTNLEFFSVAMLQSMRDDLINANENEAEILFLGMSYKRFSVGRLIRIAERVKYLSGDVNHQQSLYPKDIVTEVKMFNK
jgi:hypothetical protein